MQNDTSVAALCSKLEQKLMDARINDPVAAGDIMLKPALLKK